MSLMSNTSKTNPTLPSNIFCNTIRRSFTLLRKFQKDYGDYNEKLFMLMKSWQKKAVFGTIKMNVNPWSTKQRRANKKLLDLIFNQKI